jgi:hypothetical protein
MLFNYESLQCKSDLPSDTQRSPEAPRFIRKIEAQRNHVNIKTSSNIFPY